MEEEHVMAQRLTELVSSEVFWKIMVSHGSKVFSEPLTKSSAIRMVFELLSDSPGVMQIQREVVDEHRAAEDSSAMAKLMSLELERQDQEHQAKMAELKQHFEDQLHIRERAHSENLENMRVAFEQQLAVSQALNAQVKAEIEYIEKQPALPQVPRKPLSPGITRASTISTDPTSIDVAAVKRRADRYRDFVNHMKANIGVLESGRKSGRVKSRLFRQKSGYTMVCTNCLQNIGAGHCYSK